MQNKLLVAFLQPIKYQVKMKNDFTDKLVLLVLSANNV